jgi:hypothetical protein
LDPFAIAESLGIVVQSSDELEGRTYRASLSPFRHRGFSIVTSPTVWPERPRTCPAAALAKVEGFVDIFFAAQ